MKKEEIKPFAWGAVVGAIALPALIFAMGWAVTAGSARENAEDMATKAMIDSLAPICVAQVPEGVDKDPQMKELKAMDYWKRGDYVKKKGWATMPGSESSDGKVAEECARLLVDLLK